MTQTKDPTQNAKVQHALDALSPYLDSHPNARIEVRPRYKSFIRIRVIDSDFKGVDRLDREPEVWELLETLPDEVFTSITMLLLLTPEELEESFANLEFEALPSVGAAIGQVPCPSSANGPIRSVGNGR